MHFNGYQTNFDIIELGLFVFTHESAVCGSTIALKAELFLSLFNGKKYQGNKRLSKECSGKCFDRQELDRCPAPCEYAFVREISQIIKDRSEKPVKSLCQV